EIGIRLQYDLLPAPPRFQHERTSADRVVHRPSVRIAVTFDYLACDRGHRARAQVTEQDVVGFLQLDANRVAVRRVQAFDRRVVIELAALARRIDDGVRADDLALHVPRER